MKINQHVFLTGFMGSGKTTIGKWLAEKSQMPVLDTDQLIEANYQKKIKDIFRENGELVFRSYETLVLQEVAKSEQPTIITTGGGIVLCEENRQLMRSVGAVVFLYCDMEETMTRLANDQTRPLFKPDLEANKQRFEERLPLYKEATIIIDTSKKSVEEIVNEIITYFE